MCLNFYTKQPPKYFLVLIVNLHILQKFLLS